MNIQIVTLFNGGCFFQIKELSIQNNVASEFTRMVLQETYEGTKATVTSGSEKVHSHSILLQYFFHKAPININAFFSFCEAAVYIDESLSWSIVA